MRPKRSKRKVATAAVYSLLANLLFQEYASNVQAFSSLTVTSRSTRKQQQRLPIPIPLIARLSISHTPNVRGTGHHNAGDSSPELDEFEMDWRTVIDPQEHDYKTSAASKIPEPLTLQDWRTLGILTASVTACLFIMMKASGVGAWRYYLAGGVCAAISHAIPVPVDVIKTRKQVDPEYCDLAMPAATRRLVETEGFQALFVGMGPTVWGYFVEGAVKFGVYEILKPWLGIFMPNQFTTFCACAAFSGFAAGIMLCPMEALRIRLVAEREYAKQGWIRGGLRMMQREGCAGLFRGLTPMLYKQIPYTMTKNVSFDFLTKFMYRMWAVSAGHTMSVVIPLFAAAAASVLSCLSSQPGDMLLSLVNAHEGERRRTRDLVQQIFHSDRGMQGFFVGVKTRLLHVGLIVTVQLLIYDFVKRLFGIAATGSV